MALYKLTVLPDNRPDELPHGERYKVGDTVGDETLGDKTPVFKITAIDHDTHTAVVEATDTMRFLSWNPKE